MTPQDSLTHQPPARSSRTRKLRNALLTLVLGAVIALGGGELVIRMFLFHPDLSAGGIGQSLRQAGRYANGDSDDDYWKLISAFQGEPALVDASNPDPITGWTDGSITPGTYEHIDEVSIGERRPVLLYGDSFAQCGTPPDECFTALLERSEFAEKYAMLNYGVGGYGLDQIYLLLKNSIDRFSQRNPIVIVAVLVDSDFERSILGFRSWPKPRLDVVGEKLVVRKPVETSTRVYLEKNPISIRSYLWNLFLHQSSGFLADARKRWSGELRITAEKQFLNRRILLEIERELSSRHLKHFILVFHSESGALKRWSEFAWQEQMLEDICAEQKIPLIDTRPFLSFASDASSENCARFYGHGNPLRGHHNALGNLVCFEAIRQGLLEQFDAPDFRHLEDLKQRGLLDTTVPEITPSNFLGRAAMLITYGSQGAQRAAETSSPNRLLLRADTSGSTSVKFELSGGTKRFSGMLFSLAKPDQGCPENGLSFSIEVDDAKVLECAVPAAAKALALDINLAGKQSLTLLIKGDRGGAGCSWICIENPRLE